MTAAGMPVGRLLVFRRGGNFRRPLVTGGFLVVVARSVVEQSFTCFASGQGGDSTGFSGNSPKNRGERSAGAFAIQAGVEPKSTAASLAPGEQFYETEKANRCQIHAQSRIIWLTKMPSNRSPAALQQSGGEFSVLRIASSTI
ncbi:MAG: hypothetical protein H7839_04200 [Magnetococcus sp. YQC-5]